MTWWDLVNTWTGELALHLDPYTLAEAAAMIDAHRRASWDPFATLMATLANCHRSPQTTAWTPADFHPYHNTTGPRRRGRGRRLTAATLGDFAALLTANRRTAP